MNSNILKYSCGAAVVGHYCMSVLHLVRIVGIAEETPDRMSSSRLSKRRCLIRHTTVHRHTCIHIQIHSKAHTHIQILCTRASERDPITRVEMASIWRSPPWMSDISLYGNFGKTKSLKCKQKSPHSHCRTNELLHFCNIHQIYVYILLMILFESMRHVYKFGCYMDIVSCGLLVHVCRVDAVFL